MWRERPRKKEITIISPYHFNSLLTFKSDTLPQRTYTSATWRGWSLDYKNGREKKWWFSVHGSMMFTAFYLSTRACLELKASAYHFLFLRSLSGRPLWDMRLKCCSCLVALRSRNCWTANWYWSDLHGLHWFTSHSQIHIKHEPLNILIKKIDKRS